MYMGGLAVGSAWSTRILERGNTNHRYLLPLVQGGIASIALAWCIILWIHSSVDSTVPGLEIVFYALTAFAGIAGGFQFPVADRMYRDCRGDFMSGPGAVYGADLAGSSFGALVTASLMIPVLGMTTVLGFLAGINILIALILLLSLN